MLRLGNLNISWLYQLLLQLRITKVCISDHMGLDCLYHLNLYSILPLSYILTTLLIMLIYNQKLSKWVQTKSLPKPSKITLSAMRNHSICTYTLIQTRSDFCFKKSPLRLPASLIASDRHSSCYGLFDSGLSPRWHYFELDHEDSLHCCSGCDIYQCGDGRIRVQSHQGSWKLQERSSSGH